jgi:hypothetical protein
MLKTFVNSLFVSGAMALTAMAQTQLTIRTTEPAWISIDQQRRGLTSAGTPFPVTVTAGSHTVTAESLSGLSRQDIEVDAAANATTYVQIKLGDTGTLPQTRPPSSLPTTPSPQDQIRQQQKDLEQQQRETQIRQLEAEVTNLERQLATAQNTKDQADQAQQDCQSQQQNMPVFLGVLKAGTCVLGKMNSNNAQQQIRQLQVEIAGKQRELQRLERQVY